MSAGKGDKPRNCFSKEYKDNFDQIDWGKKGKKDGKRFDKEAYQETPKDRGAESCENNQKD